MVGAARLVAEKYSDRENVAGSRAAELPSLSAADVAVLIPARNEETGIAAAIVSVMRQVPAENIHVIADGCTDDTAEVAREYGVNVLVLTPARGKAGGIETAVEHFDFSRRFRVLLIVDADTLLDENYISRGLPLLDDPAVGAVAGYVYSSWRPGELSTLGRLLISYRARLWAVMQSMKYGQTWRYTDVTPIVPGFASMYRTEILPKMELNPPGVVIEDFNMTFELRHKRLGRVAFRPDVFGVSQDPGNLRDYYRQVTRWSLGFWQTLRRHGLWCSGFSAALLLLVVESVLAAVISILISVALVVAALPSVPGGTFLDWDWYSAFLGPLQAALSPVDLLIYVFVPDYLLTVVVAIWLRRPSLLIYGIGFLFIRLIDATATLRGLYQLRSTRSTGRWTSPVRRPVKPPVLVRTHRNCAMASRTVAARSTSPSSEQGRTATVPWWTARRNWHEARLILRDTGLASAALVLAGALIVGGVPLAVTLAAVILALSTATAWIHRRRPAHAAPRRRIMSSSVRLPW